MALSQFSFLIMRHGNTNKQGPGQSDLDRVLSDIGRDQAKQAFAKRQALGLKPDLIVSSVAGRAVDAVAPAEEDKGRVVRLKELYVSYPDPKDQAIMTEAFKRLAYAPLRVYLAERLVDAAINRWADTAIAAIAAEIEERRLQPGALVLVGNHAVNGNALARRMANDSDSPLVLDEQLGEAEAIFVRLGTVESIIRL